MRVGVVTTSFPRTEGEAAGSFVAAHVAAMRALGHDVDVIGAHTHASSLFYGAGGPDELERGGVRTYVEAARFGLALTATFVRRVRGWDLVVAHWLAPSALVALPSRVPLLAIAHGGDIHTLRRLGLLGPVLELLRVRGARLAFVSEHLREVAREAWPRLAAYLDEASIVQPMGVDVARFVRIRALRASAPLREPSRPRTVLVVARLVPIKGVDTAVRALASMRATADVTITGTRPEGLRLELHAATELVIAGEGPERERLEQLAAQLGVASRVRFLGAVDAMQRDELLARADVVVVPSRVLANGRTEGTPMIALEALAAGVPVVASAVGGLRELGAISRVPPNDPAALAVALDRALAAPVAPIDVSHLEWRQVAARLFAHAASCASGDTSGRRSA